jgi:TctA family transporter
MLQSGGDPSVFLVNPIAAFCLFLALAVFVVPLLQNVRHARSLRRVGKIAGA